VQTGSPPCIAYVVRIDGSRELEPGHPPFSPIASLRLRALIPASELARRIRVVLVPFERFLEDPGLASVGKVRAAVLGKLSVTEVETMDWRRERLFHNIANLAYPLFADFSDNYAALSTTRSTILMEYQETMGSLVPLTVPCGALAEQLRAHARHGVHVIEDPYELAETPAAFAPAQAMLRLCWFGNSYDAAVLTDQLASLAASLHSRRLRMDFVTAPARREFFAQLARRLSEVHAQMEVRFIEWSPESVAGALGDCDLIVLPQDSQSAWGRCKSHNRLVQAIRAGRVALASAIPSYEELAAFSCVGDDLSASARYALAQPNEVLERLRSGQAYVRKRFAPERVAARWAEVLGLG
jgi:hypothetical protein